jgi:DNA polymerase-3 subunit gamma/tau
MAYEALYRRYRPSRFQDAFFGQDHVVAALRNAIEGDRVGHAYLFSGPRGTGKTTSARILAKALNCTDLQGGEPCNECDSCLAFLASGSYDLHELDAASNNGVDAMRDLIGKVALGSPGRTKVYILDEVHMLSPGAENALLKTLEEPPPHVVFVLCTTEPNKVVATIRSRTQHLEFSLLSASQVGELIDYVTGDAGIEITAEDRQYVIRAGGGSARDTLSALDQVVAAGGAPQGGEHLEALFQSLIDRDASQALAAIDGALQAGRDAASIGTALLHELRIVFLAAMRADVSHLPEAERDRATTRAASMPPGRVTRAIEVIGTSIIEMRHAPDPRVDLEVAVMRLTRADLDTDPAALIERLEAIEGQLTGGIPIAVATTLAAPSSAPIEAAPAEPVAAPQPPPAPPQAQPAPAPAAPAAQSAASPQAQPAPAPAAPAAQPTAPPQPAPAAVAPSLGTRGADLVRAALVEHGIPQVPARGPASDAPPEPAPAEAAPATSGKTLADVRRERQAAAKAAGDSAEEDPAVQAATAARRERQAAAQSAGQASAPAPDAASGAMAETSALAPAVAAEAAPVAVPEAAPTPVTEEPALAAEALAPVAEAVHTVAAPVGSLPSLAELLAVWQPMLESMSGRVRSRFSAGHWVETTADSVNFGLPNPVHRDRCEEVRVEVDEALVVQFGRPIPLSLVVDMVEEEPDFFSTPPSGGAGITDDADDGTLEEDTIDVHGLVDATGDVPSAEDRVMTTFENSILLEDPQNNFPNP